MGAPRYDLLDDYRGDDPEHVVSDPHWLLAVVRQGTPLTFSRAGGRSVSTNVEDAVLSRKGAEETLIVDSDCIQLTVQRDKASHTKSLSATLAPGREYWREVQGGDWVFAWILNNAQDFERVRSLVRAGSPANGLRDGLKFIGRVEGRRRHRSVDPSSGTKRIAYQLQATGFQELDTSIFYDLNVATNDVLQQNLGKFLTRIGENVHDWLGDIASKHPERDNVNTIVPRLLDLIVGKGVAKDITPTEAREQGVSVALGGGAGEGAPNAYAVPSRVGDLLGRRAPGNVMSYADLLELLIGVQDYVKDGLPGFVPDLNEGLSSLGRRVTTKPLLGTFYISFLELLNKPLWSVLQQYTNPTINELYTCLRVVPNQKVMPCVVFRQIPLTTSAFDGSFASTAVGATSMAGFSSTIESTPFLSLPRWALPDVLVADEDLGFSEATRTNLVHVYGVASMGGNNWEIGRQMVLDPPVVDDLDIMRSGVRPYMATVDCAVDDQRDRTPGKWMRLIADWQMGMNNTLDGQVTAYGVQAPVAEGDALELDGVVYMIEGIVDQCSQDVSGGRRRWRTVFRLSNGTEAEASSQDGFPAYPLVDPARPDPTVGSSPGTDSFPYAGSDPDVGGGAGDFPGSTGGLA